MRWKYGTPPAGNANYAWVQHFIHHLAPNGIAGFVLANGSMSSMQSGEGEIRQQIVEADLVDCIVALPGQLFYATQIPVCLWFLAKNKESNGHPRSTGRDPVHRRPEARADGDPGPPGPRRRGHRRRWPTTYHEWRNKKGSYEDVAGFCKSATLDEIKTHDFVLTPGRYVGAEDAEDDGEPFDQRFPLFLKTLNEQFTQGQELEARIRDALKEIEREL